jgi:hypothetical protein
MKWKLILHLTAISLLPTLANDSVGGGGISTGEGDWPESAAAFGFWAEERIIGGSEERLATSVEYLATLLAACVVASQIEGPPTCRKDGTAHAVVNPCGVGCLAALTTA